MYHLSIDKAVAYEAQLVRYVAALAAALLFRTIGGTVGVKTKLGKVLIVATGGVGFFIAVMLLWDFPGTVGPQALHFGSGNVHLRGIVVNAGQAQGRLRLHFEETGDTIRTEPDGSFTLQLFPRPSIHVDVDGLSHSFQVMLGPDRAQFVKLELASLTPVIAEPQPK
jgi:hypothetical protein